MFEVVTAKYGAKRDDIRQAPPGKIIRVDYSRVLPTSFESDARIENIPVALSNLSPSPDGKLLGAIAYVDRGAFLPEGSNAYQNGMHFGVIISFDDELAIAHPISQNVYGNLIWNADATRVYFYSQVYGGQGNGTVCRLRLDSSKLLSGKLSLPYE